MHRIFIASLLLTTASAHAQNAATDPRALQACKAKSATFVQVADCLPEAHVGFKTLDAFETIYPPSALPLKAKCLELNPDDVGGASTCVTAAIQSAIKLSAAMPKGSTLDDPIFDAVADKALDAKLDKKIDAARADFPDQPIWGGNMYHPYK